MTALPGARAVPRALVLAFAAAIVAGVALVLLVPVFVTVDGPFHVGGAVALIELLLGHPSRAPELTTLELFPATNLLPDVPMGAVATVVGAVAAEKLVIAGYVVAFPLLVVYAVRGIDPRNWWLAFAAIALTFSMPLIYGFYNFLYGWLGFVFVAGYVARRRHAWDARSAAVLAVALTLTYMAHVLPFVQAVILLGVVTVWDWFGLDGHRPSALVRRAVLPGLACVPGTLLMLTLIGGSPPGVSTWDLSSITTLAATLTLAYGMAAVSRWEVALAAALAVTLAGMVVVAIVRRLRERGWRPSDAYLAVAVLSIVELGVIPARSVMGASGPTLIGYRLQLVAVLGVLLFLAGRSWSRPVTLGFAAVSLVVAFGVSAVRLPAMLELSDRAEAYVGIAPCLATGATMVQANLANVEVGDMQRIDPFTEDSGRLSVATGGWPLASIGFGAGFFPLRNRPETDPWRVLPTEGTAPSNLTMEGLPPAIDVQRYEDETGVPIDYVLLYGRRHAEPGVLQAPDWLRLQAALQSDYRLAATSTDLWLEAYERVGGAAAEGGEARRAAAGSAVCPAQPGP